MRNVFIVLIFVPIPAFCAFINGSFEGSAPGAYSANGADIGGWTVISTNPPGNTGVDVAANGVGWTASNGTISLDLSLLNAGGVQQNVATETGNSYRIDFDVSGNSDGAPVNKTMYVEIDGNQTPYTIDSTAFLVNAGIWDTKTIFFIATGASTNVKFVSTTNTAFGPTLDNVRLSKVATVPTLTEWGKGILGLLLIGTTLFMYRQKKAI